MSDSPFDFQRLSQAAFGRRIDYHPSIGSTNDRAKQLAADPACPTPLLVLAQRQTAGRGRGSHRWWSSEGSLTFSLLLRADTVPDDPRQAPLCSLAAALAVADALAPRLHPLPVGIHWPNDVMAADRKLAGILIEIAAGRRHIIGIGVNSNNRFDQAPDDVRRSAASLIELTGGAHDQSELLLDLLVALEKRLAELRASPAKTSHAADRLCLQRGRMLAIEQGSLRIEGRCAGIGADGSLLLDTADGRHAIACGRDV